MEAPLKKPRACGHCAFHGRPVRWAYPEGCPKLRDGLLFDVLWSAKQAGWQHVGSRDESRHPIGLKILEQVDICLECRL